MFYKSQTLVTYWLWRVITWLQLIYCKCIYSLMLSHTPPFSFISWNHCICIWCIKSIRRDSQNAAAAACYGRETRRTSHCKGTQGRGAMFYQSAKNSPSLVKFYGFRKKKNIPECLLWAPTSARHIRHFCTTQRNGTHNWWQTPGTALKENVLEMLPFAGVRRLSARKAPILITSITRTRCRGHAHEEKHGEDFIKKISLIS